MQPAEASEAVVSWEVTGVSMLRALTEMQV